MKEWILNIKNKIIVFFKWILSKIRIDKNKLGLDDAQELYIMVSDFITGGTDGIIDATDALLLLKRLQELIDANSIESDAS